MVHDVVGQITVERGYDLLLSSCSQQPGSFGFTGPRGDPGILPTLTEQR